MISNDSDSVGPEQWSNSTAFLSITVTNLHSTAGPSRVVKAEGQRLLEVGRGNKSVM